MYVRACMYLICESINASVERKVASFRIRVSSLKLCGIGWYIPSFRPQSFRIRVSSLKLCGIGWDIPSYTTEF